MEEMCMSMSDFIEKYGKLATALKMLKEVSDYFKHNLDYKDSTPKQMMVQEIGELTELCKKE